VAEQAAEERGKESWRGKLGGMTREEMEAFLTEAPWLCRIGVLDDDGWPYVQPVWYAYKDGGFYVIPRARSAWARSIQRDPRVYLLIDEPAPRLRKVAVKGRARIVEEPNVGGQWVEIAREMSYRYLGEHGPDYLVPTLNEPRWLVFVEPLEIKTWQGVGWAKRYKHTEW